MPRVTEMSVLPVPPFCTQAACGSNHTLILCRGDAGETDVSKVYAFGSNNFGQVDSVSAAAMYRNAEEITYLSNGNIMSISAGGDQSFVIRAIVKDRERQQACLNDRRSAPRSSKSSPSQDPLSLKKMLTRTFSVLSTKGLGLLPITAATFIGYLATDTSAGGPEEANKINDLVSLFSCASSLSKDIHFARHVV